MSSPPKDGSATPSDKNEQRGGGDGGEQHRRNDFISNFDPDLVHRVLLTDPAEYHDLTLSGAPRVEHTPTYEEFAEEVGFVGSTTTEGDGGGGGGMDIAAHISRTMKRAFLDVAVSAAEGKDAGEGEAEEEGGEDRPNLDPLKGLVLELHGAIRSLIPHRTDLHGRLSDEDVRTIDAGGDVLALVPRLVRAADALSQLESEDRSRTTRGWIDLAKPIAADVEAPSPRSPSIDGGADKCEGEVKGSAVRPPPSLPFGLSAAQFVAASAAYLHRKAELCSADIADFKLGTVLAPRIASEGVEYERSNFRRRFGEFDSDETAPVTREWIRRVATKACGDGDHVAAKREELRTMEGRRASLIRTAGWVDDLLFSGGGGGRRDGEDGEESDTTATAAPIAVPEVLSLDVPNLRMIRDAARTSVAGSALALHACTTAGVGDAVLRTDRLPEHVQGCRDGLVRAMANRAVGSQEQYERNVSCAVAELARTLAPDLDATKEESLASRTSAVLRGEDPVIKLLDSRMREVFRTMMEWEPVDKERIPLSMRTGRDLSLGNRDGMGTTTTYATIFKEAAKREFEKKGFAFYAPELATACLLATRVINLVFVLYGEVLMDRLFLRILED